MKMKSALLSAFALLAIIAAPLRAQVSIPAFVDYQGTVFDALTGAPLGSGGVSPNFTPAPTNYIMQFKIFGSEAGQDLIWAETQTVTVSLGTFSVRLGSGAPIAGLDPAPLQGSIADAFDAKDRFLELTVLPTGANAGAPITPRLKFQATPFAFTAKRAAVADSVTSLEGSSLFGNKDKPVTLSGVVNTTGATFSGGQFGTNDDPDAPDASFVGDGSGLTNLNIVGDGSRLTGVTVDDNSIELDKLVAAVRQALCPVGTILPYAGDEAPAGWLLCDGSEHLRTTYPDLYILIGNRFGSRNSDYFNAPDFRGRFLRGLDGLAGNDPDRQRRTAMNLGGAVGNNVGSVQNDAFERHSHTYSDYRSYGESATGRSTVDKYESGTNDILYEESTSRDSSVVGGSETRPKNAYVNYIIKL